jgi:hypothetical protein
MRTADRSKTVRMAIAVSVATLVAASPPVWAYSNVPLNRIGIYDIQKYAWVYDNVSSKQWDWKPPIGETGATSASALWTAMTSASCTNSACAYTSSFKYQDSNVTVANMNSSDHGIGAAFLVFFSGHAMSPTVWDDWATAVDPYAAWFPWTTNGILGPVNANWTWARRLLCNDLSQCFHTLYSFAAASTPLYYHQRGTVVGGWGIMDASWYGRSYGIMYAYNPLTSVLIGQDFTGVGGQPWYWENTVDQPVPSYSFGKLGDFQGSQGPVQFFISNGCELMPVGGFANHVPGGNAYFTGQAVRIWKPSWGATLHVAMGHVEGTINYGHPNLTNFATYLMGGGYGVMEAYFMAHAGIPRAYNGDLLFFSPAAVAPRGTYNGTDIYYADKWTNPRIPGPTAAQISGSSWVSWISLADGDGNFLEGTVQ